MNEMPRSGYLLEEEDIRRIANAVSEQFMECPAELDKVLMPSRRWSENITPMLDYSKESPAANYRIDMETSETMFRMIFSRYGGEIIGQFVFRRRMG